VREISLPATDYAIACYYIIATAEASSNLARYDGVRYTFRSEASGANLSDMYRQHARRGLRSGMQAAHHAGHLCAERGLLRCLLPEGAERCAR
jgi:Asp-tRNA(Asn)/Glu-tRNA(Gln) amidotransferase A subunit family amidase